MALLILCVMLCIVGPLPKVSALSSSDLEGKVAKLESKLEAMSTVVLRLVEENENLDNIAETVPRLIRENENLEAMVYLVLKENELLKSRVNRLEQMVKDGADYNDEGSDTTDDKMNKARNQKNRVMRIIDNGMQDEEEDSKRSDHRFLQKGKRILVGQTSPTDVIAFHAYLSTDSPGPLPAHHILKFDTVSLNRGHGYNAFDGIFIAPRSGTYVFTWSFMSEAGGVVSTQLMRNTAILGTRYADSATSTVWDFSTGTVVADIDQNDHVYVELRIHSHGKVSSKEQIRTTFSGWLLN